jgi:hypothetical protein
VENYRIAFYSPLLPEEGWHGEKTTNENHIFYRAGVVLR